jgi:hypothetical protein
LLQESYTLVEPVRSNFAYHDHRNGPWYIRFMILNGAWSRRWARIISIKSRINNSWGSGTYTVVATGS